MADLYPGMSGGKKQKWLRLHRGEVLAFAEVYGVAEAREKYNITKDETWYRLSNPRYPEAVTQTDKLTKADKALLRVEIVEQGERALRAEIRELREQFAEFIPALAQEISNNVLLLLLRNVKLPESLEYKPKNHLSLTNLQAKSSKRGQK